MPVTLTVTAFSVESDGKRIGSVTDMGYNKPDWYAVSVADLDEIVGNHFTDLIDARQWLIERWAAGRGNDSRSAA